VGADRGSLGVEPARQLVAFAEEELALVQAGRYEELALLAARRTLAMAELGPRPTVDARAHLERAAELQAEVTATLEAARAEVGAQLARLAHARQAARGYGGGWGAPRLDAIG
jgi:hypothetical protein